MSTQNQILDKMSKETLIKWVITVICTVGVLCIPESGIFNFKVKLFFAETVFGLLVIAFEFWPTLIMAVLMPVLWVISGVTTTNVAFSPWTGKVIYMVVGAFMISAALEQCGLLKRIAFWLMSKVNGSYVKLLMSLYLVGVLLTFATSGSGCYMIMGALCAGLCVSLNVMQTKTGAGIAMAAMVGTCTSKAFIYPASNYAVILGAPCIEGLVVSPALVVVHNWPMFIVCTLIMYVIAKMCKPDEKISGKEYFVGELEKMGKISHDEKANGILLILILVYMFTTTIHGYAVEYGFMLIPWLAYLPFIHSANEDTLKFFNWQMIFFIVGCMAIGSVAADLGIGDFVGGILTDAFADGASFTIIFGFVYALVFVLNFLMTPMAIWAVISEPVMQMALGLGIDPLLFVYALNTTAEAIILPYEYVPYLCIYAFGMIKMSDFVKFSIIRCAIYILGFMIILLPYWKLIGLM